MLKKAVAIGLIVLSLFSLFAEELDSEDYLLLSDIPITYGDLSFRERILERTKGERDPIGLVLTGGSARAIAHLGVLEYLEENGIVPDFIVSNSMGSIVGLLYAAGLEPEQIAEMVMIGDLSNYFSITFPTHGGLLDPTNFKSLVKSVVGVDLRLEDLEIPVMVISDDLVTKREIRIAEGNFADILIASFALPVYFPPREYNGHILIDGGVKSLVPLNVAYEYSDTVIVSTTFYDLDSINLYNMISILNGAFDIGKRQKAVADMKEYNSFIWIRCAVEQFSFMDFSSALEMKEIGYESAKEQKDELDKLYKSGTEEFEENRKRFSAALEDARRSLYYFDRVKALEPTHILSFGLKNYEDSDSYMNESVSLGLQYGFRYNWFEFEVLGGWAFNTHAGSYGLNGPVMDLGFKFYPHDSVRVSADFSATWYEWTWMPSIYNREMIEWRALFIPQVASITPFESFEFIVAPEEAEGDMAFHYLLNAGLNATYESNIWALDTTLSYMLKDLSHYVNFELDNTISLPLSFFLSFGVTERARIDGQKGVSLYFKDGFESTLIDPRFGYNFDAYSLTVTRLRAGYELPFVPTIGEFLIIEDSSVSAYFDCLFSDASFYYSTGAEIETKLSLIGLVDLPMRLRLGYSSHSDSFTGSILFSLSH